MSRRTMLAPIRPSPIIPSCMVVFFSCFRLACLTMEASKMLRIAASSRALNSASDCWRQQPLGQAPRKARHDAVIPAQPFVAFFPRITTRQRNYPHHLRMGDEISVTVVLLGQRKLEHDQLPSRQLIELSKNGGFEPLFGFGFRGAMNIHFRFDDGHEARRQDLRRRLRTADLRPL